MEVEYIPPPWEPSAPAALEEPEAGTEELPEEPSADEYEPEEAGTLEGGPAIGSHIARKILGDNVIVGAVGAIIGGWVEREAKTFQGQGNKKKKRRRRRALPAKEK